MALFAVAVSACSSSTTIITPWSQGVEDKPRGAATESTVRATSAYQ